MSHPEALSQWIETVSSMLPKLSRPQAKVLAYWSYGMVLARSCGITLVCAALALQVQSSEQNLLQRLREWCYGAKDKKGKKRRELDVSTCFGPRVAMDSRMVACRSATTGARLGCHHVEETLYGAVHQRSVSGLRHSGGLESGGRRAKGSLGAALAQASGAVGGQRTRALDGDRDE